MTISQQTRVGESLKQFGLNIYPSALMADYTTFRLGGPCQYLIGCETPLQLAETISILLHEGIRFIVIGGGSNLVVSDKGVDCAVVRYVTSRPLIQQAGHDLIVSGSTLLDDLMRYAAEHGLQGLNYASGIPGTVGGAIAGNAGAFGQQVGDVLSAATLISLKGIKQDALADQLQFSYRYSLLKETGAIVQLARFSLSSGDREKLLKERADILAVRRAKHPDLRVYPCAGSFFRNIEPTSAAGQRQAAGWFLDQAGGKKLSHGGAVIFDKHANIIVKSDGCTAQDVYELSCKMESLVKGAFDLDLVREVRFVGQFENAEGADETIIW